MQCQAWLCHQPWKHATPSAANVKWQTRASGLEQAGVNGFDVTNCSWLLLKSLQVPLADEAVTASFCCPTLRAYVGRMLLQLLVQLSVKWVTVGEKYGRKIYWERSKFPWHYIMRRRNNIARKPGLSFCPRNLRASKRKSISWDLHTVVLKLTHLYYHAGVAGELFPFCRWWKQGSVLSSVSQSVKTILFDPGFVPSRIRSTLWALFSACKLICLNPLPFPFSLCDFQPRCTGTAVLWVRRYGQMDDTWATGVWLFIQTKACWWYEGWFPSSGGWWHIYSLKWVYPLHLSSLYTYFRAHSFVLSFQSF